MKTWYTSTVLKGDQAGRTIGFPTVNLDPTVLSSDTKKGVYACVVRHGSKSYAGTLYFGPRLVKGESHDVLEIFIHDFSDSIYGSEIMFSCAGYIRPVMDFGSFDDLKKQIEDDIDKSKKFIYNRKRSSEIRGS